MVRFSKRNFVQMLAKVATVALLSTAASNSLAQEVSPELDAWLKENALGPYATMEEN